MVLQDKEVSVACAQLAERILAETHFSNQDMYVILAGLHTPAALTIVQTALEKSSADPQVVRPEEVLTSLRAQMIDFLQLEDETDRCAFMNRLALIYGLTVPEATPEKTATPATFTEALRQKFVSVFWDGRYCNVRELAAMSAKDLAQGLAAEVTFFGSRLRITFDQHMVRTYSIAGSSFKPYMGMYSPDVSALAVLDSEYRGRVIGM